MKSTEERGREALAMQGDAASRKCSFAGLKGTSLPCPLSHQKRPQLVVEHLQTALSTSAAGEVQQAQLQRPASSLQAVCPIQHEAGHFAGTRLAQSGLKIWIQCPSSSASSSELPPDSALTIGPGVTAVARALPACWSTAERYPAAGSHLLCHLSILSKSWHQISSLCIMPRNF